MSGDYFSPRAFLVAVLCVAAALRACHGSDAKLRERLQSEAPGQWAKLIEQTKRLDCKVIDTRTWTGFEPPRPRELIEHIVKFSGPNALYHQKSTTDGALDEFVVGINPDYAFRIERKYADGPWILAYVGADPGAVKSKFEGDADVLARFCLHVGDMWLPELMKAPGFEIKDVSFEDHDGTQFVKLDFRYSPSPESSSFIRGGSILLDPANHWAIRQYTLQTISGSKKEPSQSYAEVEYDSDAEGELVLKRLNYRVPSRQTREFQWLREYELYEHRTVPDGEFRLTAFDLPEPREQPGLLRGRLWVLLVVVGIGCIMVAVALRRRALQSQ